MTATDNGRRSSRRGGLVLVAERGTEATPIAEELRRAGLSVVTCDVVALPERVARMFPTAVVLHLDQPHVEAVIPRVLEPRDLADRPLLAAVGTYERAADLTLIEGPRLRIFEPPIALEDLVEFIAARPRDSIPASSATSQSEIPSSVGSLPGDSDAMLMSDFPALAGLPEVESILPELEMSASFGTRGDLSPEIGALLEDAQKRVDRAPPEPDNEPTPHIVVPPEMMAAIDGLLAAEDARPPPQVSEPWFEASPEEPLRGEFHPPLEVDDEDPEATRSGEDQDEAAHREAVTSSSIPQRSSKAEAPRRETPTEPPRTAVGEGLRQGRTSVGEAAASSRFPGTEAGWSRPGPPSGVRSSDAPPTMLQQAPQAPVPYPLAPSAFPPPRGPASTQHPQAARPGAAGRRPGGVAPSSPVSVESSLPRGVRISANPPTRIQAASPQTAPPPATEGVGDPIQLIADAVAQRAGGALVLSDEAGEVTRYLLLREGDIFNATSEHPDDSLLSFLVERGDLSMDVARSRRGRIPNAGRHAAAALIAHGYLGQDDLWPVLRAHAEWVLIRVLRTVPSLARLDDALPERFRTEPNVFGGAAGAEVLVESVRRVLSPESALRRLGGPQARLFDGPRADLMAEAALEDHEREVIHRGRGESIGDLQRRAEELIPVVVTLAALGVVTVEQGRQPAAESTPPSFDPLDAEAIRERVRARLALVHEGDYFSLLGVGPQATTYEIRRAFVTLRQTFEPTRLLVAATADLHEDVLLICEVLEEAYEILRDPKRRRRYQRAIEAMAPP